MKTYSRQSETKSDTAQPKASQQASAHDILQTYKDKIAQRQEIDEDELLQGKFEIAQRKEINEDELLQGKFETAQPSTENLTGMPDNLKSGIESLSGYSMDDVRVHYNSSKPAQLQALAYAQGTDIHIAPGQEQHLPHEAWHVVQQKQGRVQPTTQLQGVNVNDNEGLEKEADVMGGKAVFVDNKYSDTNKNNISLMSNIIRQYKYPTAGATPLLYDQRPELHPEYPLFFALMSSLGFPDGIIDYAWTMLLMGFREQDFIQHQLEQLQFGENINIDGNTRNIIRNDNICFQEVATMLSDYLSTGGQHLALWSGGIDLSDYAFSRGFVPLERTPLGLVINQIEFHRDWLLQAPLWNILSTVFVRQQPASVHVFLRTFEVDAVLFRQEIPVIREIFPNIPILWHAIYTLEDRSMLEINNNLSLEEQWGGFNNEELCVTALLEFYLDYPNNQTERGLDTILRNIYQ